MTAQDLQDALTNLFDTLADARDEIEEDDDDITLADLMRDLQGDLDECIDGRSYAQVGMLTGNEGLVVRTTGGDEFQITIVQSRFGTGAQRDDAE